MLDPQGFLKKTLKQTLRHALLTAASWKASLHTPDDCTMHPLPVTASACIQSSSKDITEGERSWEVRYFSGST